MTADLSPNTQAILLLTAPLIIGRGSPAPDLLSAGQYRKLARHLRELQFQPADLLSESAPEILHHCGSTVEVPRMQRLLGRGFLLAQAIERWKARAIWVFSRADIDYPRRLKSRLREDAPAVMYGCGDLSLLDSGGLAVVGSRNADESLIEYTMAVGRLAARSGESIISGGARGIDSAAMRGALEAEGKVVGVLADGLEKTAMTREYRNLLMDGKLALISPYDPCAGFNVGHAMQRNKLIYALADISLVVSADANKGGTWAGAIEQLEKLRLVPVYVRTTADCSAGISALAKKGAMPWPEPRDTHEFRALLASAKSAPPAATQAGLPLFSIERNYVSEPDTSLPASSTANYSPDVVGNELVAEPSDAGEGDSGNPAPPLELTPADALFAAVSEAIQRLLRVPMKEAEVAVALNISSAQAKSWLQRLLSEGTVEKQTKPAGYIVKQSRLFD